VNASIALDGSPWGGVGGAGRERAARALHLACCERERASDEQYNQSASKSRVAFRSIAL